MNITAMLLDVPAVGGGVAIAVLGVAFFFVLAAIAFVAYRLLKKTVKWGIRLAIAGVILFIGLVGAIAFMYFGSTGPQPARPAPTRPK